MRVSCLYAILFTLTAFVPAVDLAAADIRYEEEAMGLTASSSALAIRAEAGLSDSDQVGISGPPS